MLSDTLAYIAALLTALWSAAVMQKLLSVVTFASACLPRGAEASCLRDRAVSDHGNQKRQIPRSYTNIPCSREKLPCFGAPGNSGCRALELPHELTSGIAANRQ